MYNYTILFVSSNYKFETTLLNKCFDYIKY